MLAVDLQRVTKIYRGGIRALDGVALQVRMGEIFGLLGPNGAGKSTLVKIMMTVVRPSNAEGTILGQSVGTSAVLADVGYLPEHHRFPPYLTGRQVIDFFGALSKVPRKVRRSRTQELLHLVGMADWADKRVTQYSKGMQQRVGIAASLVNDPKLLVLDEPTDGVDPVGRRDIRDLLIRLRAEGRAVLVNSHLLGEVEMVADRVAIMSRGQVLAQGSIQDLTRDSHRFEVEAVRGPLQLSTAAGVLDALQVGEERVRYVVRSLDPHELQSVIDALRAHGALVVQVAQTRETLEDLFVRSVVDERGAYTPGARLPGTGVRQPEQGAAGGSA